MSKLTPIPQEPPAKPPSLRPGDTVMVVSPSYPALARAPKQRERGISFLEAQGFHVIMGETAMNEFGHLSAPAQRRAEDINEGFARDDVRAIFCAFGGGSELDILPFLDYATIAAHPKIFAGHSASAGLMLAIYRHSRLVTFLGPSLMRELGAVHVHPATWKWFTDIVQQGKPVTYRETASVNRPGDAEISRGPRSWATGWPGKVQGPLIGATLPVLCAMVSTPWLPNLAGAVLFWDVVRCHIAEVELMLMTLKLHGVFGLIGGMVVGRPARSDLDSRWPGVVTEIAQEFRLPTLLDVDCGHHEPVMTMPLGCNALLDATNRTLAILETPVKA